MISINHARVARHCNAPMRSLFSYVPFALAALLAAAGPVHAAAPPRTGKALYEYYCYQCHGYSGDGQTVAAAYVQPKPRDFTRTPAQQLTRAAMLDAVARGRPGTAMRSFARVLSREERTRVIDYVRSAFMQGARPELRYHTAANGWRDHERAAPAFPFATGEIPLDAPVETMSPAQRNGRRLFLETCTTCHEGSRQAQAAPAWDPRAVSYPRSTETCDGCHESARLLARAPAQATVAGRGQATDARGRELFLRNCAFCHGTDGSGRNWIGTFLEPHARDLRQPRFAARSAEALRQVIRDGLPGTSMPGWGGVLSAEELDAVAAYVGHTIAAVRDPSPAVRPAGDPAAQSRDTITWRRLEVPAPPVQGMR